MIHLFCGYDQREAIGFHVFVASVLANASDTVALRRIDSKGMRHGSNAFSFSRFLVPYAMGFEGMAIFADASDMLMLGNISDLAQQFNPAYAVQVVKHQYATRNPRKYVGTPMECPNLDYPRKNWASLMLINCGHEAWRGMSPDVVSQMSYAPIELLGLQWLHEDEIGELPDAWNRLVDEGQPVPGAQLLHFTAGIPAFAHYAKTPGAVQWRTYRNAMNWIEE